MASAELVDYIKEQLKAGYSADEVRRYLVGYGYPVRDVEDAIDIAKRPVSKTVLPQISEKKVEQIIAKAESAKAVEEEFLSIFKAWFMTLFMPGSVFPYEKSRATTGRALMNVLISASFGGIIAGIILVIKLLVSPPNTAFEGVGFFGLAPISTIQRISVSPIGALFAWLVITAFFYLFSLLLGGRGSFERFSYFTSLISAPLAFLLTILAVLLPKCGNFFAIIVFGALGIYPMIYAIKEAHETDTMNAVLSAVIPILLIAVLMVPALLRFSSMFRAICP